MSGNENGAPRAASSLHGRAPLAEIQAAPQSSKRFFDEIMIPQKKKPSPVAATLHVPEEVSISTRVPPTKQARIGAWLATPLRLLAQALTLRACTAPEAQVGVFAVGDAVEVNWVEEGCDDEGDWHPATISGIDAEGNLQILRWEVDQSLCGRSLWEDTCPPSLVRPR